MVYSESLIGFQGSSRPEIQNDFSRLFLDIVMYYNNIAVEPGAQTSTGEVEGVEKPSYATADYSLNLDQDMMAIR